MAGNDVDPGDNCVVSDVPWLLALDILISVARLSGNSSMVGLLFSWLMIA